VVAVTSKRLHGVRHNGYTADEWAAMPRKILVVEDDRKTVDIIRLYLQRERYHVLVAANGREALELARSRQPDLILLDLMLPQVAGLDVCRILRAESKVPIIMLTAKTTEEDKLLGLDLGADDYIVKPFSPRELVARVRVLLRRLATSTELHDPSQIQAMVKKLAQATGQRIIFVDQSHHVIGDSDGTLLGQLLPERDVRINGAALLAGLLGIVLTILLSARILRPVRALTRAAQQMQRGDLSQRVPVRSKDEFGDLAHAFNAMADSLAHSEQLRRVRPTNSGYASSVSAMCARVR
jgi:DNA-binding response OmpR family regulator